MRWNVVAVVLLLGSALSLRAEARPEDPAAVGSSTTSFAPQPIPEPSFAEPGGVKEEAAPPAAESPVEEAKDPGAAPKEAPLSPAEEKSAVQASPAAAA